MNDPLQQLEDVQAAKRQWLRDHGKAELAKDYTTATWWIYKRMQRAIANKDKSQIDYYLRLAGAKQ